MRSVRTSRSITASCASRAMAALVLGGLALAACQKPAALAKAGEAQAHDGAAGTRSACGRELTAADVADLLGPGPVAVRQSPVNAEACDFRAGPMAAVTVGLRAGDEIDDAWKLTVSLNHEAMIPLAGVGEQALMSPDGSEVLARAGQLSCQVDVIGLDAALGQPAIHGDRQALAVRLGGLCAKVFAARSGSHVP